MSRSYPIHLPHAIARSGLILMLVLALLLWPSQPAAALGTDIIGPAGSGAFGTTVTVLPNGNIVVTDPLYDQGATLDVGAVYLYSGATLALISTLTGSTTNDQIGNLGVTVLTNGNYVIHSHKWDNGALVDAGAVTWGSGTSGVAGIVNATNSLVGSTAHDQVGSWGIVALTNGNYVARTPYWNNGAIQNVGAVTWGSGTTGIVGTINATNSLVGAKASDQVGKGNVIALPSGNYVVQSPDWDNGASVDAGAVTWGSGTTGVAGTVNATNSLVGSTANDMLGDEYLSILPNGNYLVRAPFWDNGAAQDAGAITWASGTAGVVGAINATNSLVGSTAYDRVSNNSVDVLANGNYIVSSQAWDNGSAVNAGAVTWGSGATGIVGAVNATNSLVGSNTSDRVGSYVTELANGNYVVTSWYWNNGLVTQAGAATWGSGTAGVTGAVDATNSLIGSTTNDYVGSVRPLTNGNYVVTSWQWDNGVITDTGAVTWGNGVSGSVGPVTATNSLIGTTSQDRVGYDYVTALSNGNYVVSSPYWDNGSAANGGAVTWGSGATGIVGVVSTTNSLVGSTTNDLVGYGYKAVTALTNGNYVVTSQYWNNGAVARVGAVTWGNGSTGIVGAVTVTNSLVGTTTNDRVGIVLTSWDSIRNGVTALANGNYVVGSSLWDNGVITNTGAVTWGNGASGVTGPVDAANSLVGSSSDDRLGSGFYGVTALPNGSYVVGNPFWDNGSIVDAGAVTWGSATSGVVGSINAANSLVGTTENDKLGEWWVSVFSNDSYAVISPGWDNRSTVDAGAVTWGSGTASITGTIDASNSVLGLAADGGGRMISRYDPVNQRLLVGRPVDNRVTVSPTGVVGYRIALPLLLR